MTRDPIEEQRLFYMRVFGLKSVEYTAFEEADRPFVKFLVEENGYLAVRKLPDGTWAGVIPMGYNVRLTKNITWGGVSGNYCYAKHKVDEAMVGLALLKDADDDPYPGWHRHIESGRRREDGDPERETINW